jgi:hypothetical protein
MYATRVSTESRLSARFADLNVPFQNSPTQKALGREDPSCSRICLTKSPMNSCCSVSLAWGSAKDETYRDVLDSVETETVSSGLLEDPFSPVPAGQPYSAKKR